EVSLSRPAAGAVRACTAARVGVYARTDFMRRLWTGTSARSRPGSKWFGRTDSIIGLQPRRRRRDLFRLLAHAAGGADFISGGLAGSARPKREGRRLAAILPPGAPDRNTATAE